MGVLLHRPLLEAYAKAFPRGVVNTIYGDGQVVIEPIMTSGKVACLAFIGSSKVADILKSQHPMPHRLRCVLGLEAKNPAIILPDCDIEVAVDETLMGALSFNGQRCTALKIIFVHQSIHDSFVAKLTSKISENDCGLPWEKGVKYTPLPELKHVQFLKSLIDDATSKGAQIANKSGGEIQGTFLYPTVITNIASGMRLYDEEQFGPIVAIAKFEDIGTPISYIENSKYGQQVALFGKNSRQIAELIDPLVNQVCRVNINSQCQRGPDIFPFTGRKDSAEGTLSVSDALRVFSIRTLVAGKTTESNKMLINDIVKNRESKFLSTDFIL
jgi:glyceraldehyde-3-phosphate dehydrogenase (NADP+)